MPGGYGQYRALRRYRDPSYDHTRDKHPVRAKHAADLGWLPPSGATVLARDYASYEEYTTPQKQKFDEMLKLQGGFSNRTIFEYRRRFYRRFRQLKRLLPPAARILCLGARQGTEVEVLRDLGFRNAHGIDLNPGPDNPLVRAGDFMNLDERDGSVDMIYTNCVDHAFDLEKFFAEHARVLAPGGYALYDLAADQDGARGAFEAVTWARTEDVLIQVLQHFETIVNVKRERDWVWVLVRDKRVVRNSGPR